MRYSEVSSVEDGRIRLRDRDLIDEVIGHLSFTEGIHFAILGVVPEPAQGRVLDAVLVSLIDHGVTSSTLAARMTISAAPEALQGAIAAGVLNSGGRVLGAMEGCGRILAEWSPAAEADGIDATAAALVAAQREAKRRIPGMGQAQHEEGDERARRLFEVARAEGVAGVHVELLSAVERELEVQGGRFLPINVTGGIAAILLDLGYPVGILRGFGILSRVPGLIAHLSDELEHGTGRRLIRHLQQDGAWDVLD